MIGYKDILFDLPDTEYAYESDAFADDVEAMRQQQDGMESRTMLSANNIRISYE